MQHFLPVGHEKLDSLNAPSVQFGLQSCIGTDSQFGAGVELPDGEELVEILGVADDEGVIDTLELLDIVGVAEILALVDEVGDIVGVGLSLGFGQHRSLALVHLKEALANGASPPGHVLAAPQVCPATDEHNGGLQHFRLSGQK